MKKISEEDFTALAKTGNGRKHPVTAGIQGLAIGEILQISPADWKWKRKTPSLLVTREEKSSSRRFEFYKLTQEGGWVVKRIK